MYKGLTCVQHIAFSSYSLWYPLQDQILSEVGLKTLLLSQYRQPFLAE